VTTIAEAHIPSGSSPAAFFARRADMATWPEWNTDTEWVRLDGPFAQGPTGVLKPKGGPKARFEVAVPAAGREFPDVSRLSGARLTFRHLVSSGAEGTRADVEVGLTGPLAPVWNLIWNPVLGKGVTASLPDDLDRLAAAMDSSVDADSSPGAAKHGADA
jgi:hypothetical protein